VDISSARSQESLSGSLVSTELRREGRFKGKLLLVGGRGRYIWCRGSVGGMCQKGILRVLGLCGTESGEDVLQELVDGFMLTVHLVHVDRLVINHIGGQHGGNW